jgi:hypothetical protein
MEHWCRPGSTDGTLVSSRQHRWNIGVVPAAPMEHWCRSALATAGLLACSFAVAFGLPRRARER